MDPAVLENLSLPYRSLHVRLSGGRGKPRQESTRGLWMKKSEAVVAFWASIILPEEDHSRCDGLGPKKGLNSNIGQGYVPTSTQLCG
jgi:hypothetical protein